MNYTFKILIEECEEGGYFAQCPSFPGCHVEAENYKEAKDEIQKAILAFIEEYKNNGEKIPQDKISVDSVMISA